MEQPKIFVVLFLVVFFLLLPVGMKGQLYRMEVGLLGGSSFYMGDANQNELFKCNHFTYGALARYHIDERFSIKANALVAGISGSTAGFATSYLNGEEVSFNRSVYDAGIQLEMNFYNYGAVEYLPGASRISPYVFMGVGMTGYKADRRKVCANLPFGLGIKAKTLPRMNIGCEWSFIKTYADDLDFVNNSSGFQLKDPWSASGAWNKNKDWYSILMIYISYDIYGVGSKCFR
jgi:hypothetical protein